MSIKIKQRDMTDCGPACLASVGAYHKLQIPISQIRQISGTDTKGTNVLGIITAAEKLGFSAKGVKGNKNSLQKIPKPTIAHVITKDIQHHYVVIYKVKGVILEYMDPGDEKMHKIPIDQFCEMWTGVLILLIPGDNFHSHNEKISNFKRFSYLLLPHKNILTQCLFGAIIYTVLGLSTSIFIQKITDNVIPSGNKNLLNLLGVGMLLIMLLQIFLGVTQSLFMLKTGQ